jgi:hypothetical protein
MTEPSDSAHLTDEQLAAFLDNRVSIGEHTAALTHMAVCADCRREVVAARHVLAPRRTVSRLGIAGMTAAAAMAAALAFVMVNRGSRQDVAEPPVRAAEHAMQPDRLAALSVVAPADRSTIDSVTAFRWRAVERETTYRVTVQDEIGSVAWTAAVSDTFAVLPRGVTLVKGRQYFWTVDAQLLDGSTASSGVHRFTIRP